MSDTISKKLSILDLKKKKQNKEKIVCLTCYDYFSARLIDSCNIDLVLIGDSLGMVFGGYENTLSVTVDEIIYHTRAVKNGIKAAFLVADMPFGSYQVTKGKAIKNAIKIIKKGGAQAVKLEGGGYLSPVIKSMASMGINIIGHIGLMPQFVNKMGGYKIQGKTDKSRDILIDDAKRLEDAGIDMIVLEGIVEETAKTITETLSIPTIGIGSGRFCDGQILVFHDIFGLNTDYMPSFVKKYANIGDKIVEATKQYIQEVKSGEFPSEEYTFK